MSILAIRERSVTYAVTRATVLESPREIQTVVDQLHTCGAASNTCSQGPLAGIGDNFQLGTAESSSGAVNDVHMGLQTYHSG